MEKTALEYDVESKHSHLAEQRHGAPVYIDETGAVPGESFATGNTLYAKLQRMVGKYGVEQRGIERVPADEQTDTNMWKIATMWLSPNMALSSFALGVLAVPVFALGFVDSVLVIIFFNFISILPVCFFSCFGPKFGLRQMVLSRFWFGYYGVKVAAVLQVLACIGWSAVNTIVGAQLISAVNPDVPGYAGIIILAVCTFLVTLFGYKVVHAYEFWSWIPNFIIYMIVLGQFAHTGDFVNIPMGVGTSEVGGVLSFAGTIFAFGAGWTSFAADYTVYKPAKTPSARVFLWTFAGLMIPLLFSEILGLAIATAIESPPADADPTTFVGNSYTEGYNTAGIGGLFAAVLVDPFGRFGQFCLIVLSLTTVAVNCPNVYSLSLSIQLVARQTQAVPRFIWVFLGTVAYCAIAIPGYTNFSTVLSQFMAILSYWLGIYLGISLTDHFFFRKGFTGYDASLYNRPGELPSGFAAIAAFCFGVMGAVLGMAQVWFIGPIAAKIGDPAYGGDVGFELAFAFSTGTYLAFRTIEKRVAGR